MGVRAIWISDSKKYVLVGDPSKVVKKEDEIYITIKELIKEISEMNKELLEDISRAKIIYDPYKIITSLKEGIKRGFFLGSKEMVVGKITAIILKLKEIERLMEDILINVYQAATDAAQAIILKRTGKIVVPKHISKFLKENVPEFTEDAMFYEKIYEAIKDYEHKRKIPSPKEMDELIYYASEIFEDAERI